MSIPILYTATTTEFSTNGVGALSDAVSCVVSEERNGLYELEMEYPINGVHYSDIVNDAIIRVRTNEKSGLQPFRIYKISKPIDGIVTVYAQHISYQLASIPVAPFSASSAYNAITGLKDNAAVACPFTFWTDVTTEGTFHVAVPAGLRSLLGGQTGSILDVYGGEYEFDGYNVKLWNARGDNNGVKIVYGKNLTDVKQEEYISNLCTGVYPYWAGNGGYVELPEKVIALQTTYSYPRIKPLDLSSEFETAPTEEQLRAKAQDFLATTDLKSPTVSIDVKFAQIWQTDEYKTDPLYQQVAGLEKLGLCDTVTVSYPALGVNCTAKITAYKYDCLLERYIDMNVGSVKTSLADTIVSTEATAEAAHAKNRTITTVQAQFSRLMANALGYYHTEQLDEQGRTTTYIHDKPLLSESSTIWKVSVQGFAVSLDGGKTWSGGFTAETTLIARLIQTNKIESLTNPNVYFDLVNGIIAASELRSSNENAKDTFMKIGEYSINGSSYPAAAIYGTDEIYLLLANPFKGVADIFSPRGLYLGSDVKIHFGVNNSERGSIDEDGYHGKINGIDMESAFSGTIEIPPLTIHCDKGAITSVGSSESSQIT